MEFDLDESLFISLEKLKSLQLNQSDNPATETMDEPTDIRRSVSVV